MGQTIYVPADATMFPPSTGPQKDYQPLIMASTASQVSARNSNEAGKYSGACSEWLAANMQHRDYGLPLTPKPVAPQKEVVNQVMVGEGDTVSWPGEVKAGTMFQWITEDGGPVGPPCPDLPAVLQRVSGHVHIGRRLAGDYFVKAADDTYPLDGPPVPAVSDEMVRGLFQPVAGPMAGMGWWLKVG